MTCTSSVDALSRPPGRLSFFVAFVRRSASSRTTLSLLLSFGAFICAPCALAQESLPAHGISPNGAIAEIVSAGSFALRQHEYARAIEQFESALALEAENPAARSGELQASTALALEAKAAGNPQRALAILQHARAALPNDPVLLTRLGIQAQQMKLPVLAGEALASALALDPRLPDALYAAARVEIDEDRLQAAEGHLRTYLEQRPDDASAHFGLGHVLERQQRTEAAAAEFKRSIELKPAQTESYFQLGQMALDIHEDDLARGYFQKVLARNPAHGGALAGDGILAYRLKRYSLARERLAAAVAASPEYQPAHYYLGLTLNRIGERAQAERELQVAVDLARKQQGKGEPVPPEPAGHME